MVKQGANAATPKLRFPEFVDAQNWSVAPMRKLYAFMRNNLLSRDKLNYERGVAKNIHYGDIHTKFQALFDISRESVPFINESESVPGADSEDYCVEGDMIFADASEDMRDVGKCIEVVRLAGERLLAGQHTILARPKDDALVIGFAGHLFRSRLIRSRIEKEAQGTKVYQISSSRLGGIDITYPIDKGEQQKIVDCLTSLDEVIAAQGRKVEALKAHKRGLMQQLFPREGETRPRLRFPEFRDAPEWKPSILTDVCRPQQWRTISSSELTEDGYPVYGANGFIGRYPSFNHEFETVAVTCRGSTCGEVLLIPPKSYITGNSMCLDEIDATKHSYHFIFHLLKHRGLDDVISGSAQPQIVGQAIKKLKFLLPDLPEQQRIADCLASLDTQITAETARLAALKTHKQGLMQQLFPVLEGP